jgi:starch synthase
MPLRILFVAAEYAPLAKTGGLADVTSALSRFLHHNGQDVRVFLPYYRTIAEQPLTIAVVPGLEALELMLGAHRYTYRILTAQAPGSDLPLYFVDCPALYDRQGIYTNDADEHRRFLLLTRAAFESALRMDFAPDLLHCHDWHTAFGPLLHQTRYADHAHFRAMRSVLTIHNIGYQGVFSSADVTDLGLNVGTAGGVERLDPADLAQGRINALKHGVLYADLITTVSPTYAQEITTPQYGEGLDGILRARRDRLVGILNGADYAEWSPDRDPHLPVHFSKEALAGKRILRQRLATRLGLRLESSTLLIGLVSRLVSQKGFDLLPPVLPDFLNQRDLALVALGTGEPHYESFLRELTAAHPHRVYFHRGYHEELAHWIEAASDAFLMPSRYEPCGLNQIYSLRYGTIPIVRHTGGLADSVTHYCESNRDGTGVVFRDYDAPALRWALDTTLSLHEQPTHWDRMMQNAMTQDFSWDQQGALYLTEYRKLLTTT